MYFLQKFRALGSQAPVVMQKGLLIISNFPFLEIEQVAGDEGHEKMWILWGRGSSMKMWRSDRSRVPGYTQYYLDKRPQFQPPCVLFSWRHRKPVAWLFPP